MRSSALQAGRDVLDAIAERPTASAHSAMDRPDRHESAVQGRTGQAPFGAHALGLSSPLMHPPDRYSAPPPSFALAPPGTSSRSASPCGRSSAVKFVTHQLAQQNDGSPAQRKTISHAAPLSRSQRAVRPSPRHRSTANMSIGISSATGSPFSSRTRGGRCSCPRARRTGRRALAMLSRAASSPARPRSPRPADAGSRWSGRDARQSPARLGARLARNGWSAPPHWECSPRRSRRRSRSASGAIAARKRVRQIAFVVRGLVDQDQVILATTACSLAMIDAPEVDMAAIGQPDLAEHGIDRSAGYRPRSAARSPSTAATSMSWSARTSPTRLPDSAASTASVIKIVDLPHRLPATNATRRCWRTSSSASSCDGCSGSGRVIAPRGMFVGLGKYAGLCSPSARQEARQ